MTPPPVVVLGATGSIGRQALEVAGHLGREVVGLAVRTPRPEVADLARRFPDARLVVAGGAPEERRLLLSEVPRAEFGPEGLASLAGSAGAVVVNGIVGAAGLAASVSALGAGNRLALANKESLIVGGEVVKAAAREGGGEIVPVDSEHSALFQLLAGVPAGAVDQLVLTASGGPFRGWEPERLAAATPDEALRHPTWRMGRRITVDSATLANKGLEVIEAHLLFDLAFDRIEVVVHPQSTVHSLVRLVDGVLLAHLGAADMRVPIQYALTHPGRVEAPYAPFSLAGLTLGFEPPDRATFRALDLAYQAGRLGGSGPTVYNAADEVAVEAFLAGRLGFLGIAELIERTLGLFEHRSLGTVEEVLSADREARGLAASLLAGVC
jgi:1-deoxy-D-xylulose-5-phosphate reductoisomerase